VAVSTAKQAGHRSHKELSRKLEYHCKTAEIKEIWTRWMRNPGFYIKLWHIIQLILHIFGKGFRLCFYIWSIGYIGTYSGLHVINRRLCNKVLWLHLAIHIHLPFMHLSWEKQKSNLTFSMEGTKWEIVQKCGSGCEIFLKGNCVGTLGVWEPPCEHQDSSGQQFVKHNQKLWSYDASSWNEDVHCK
jgi:hypothetical protein